MKADTASSFGAALREVRTAKGLTLRVLAERCGTGYSHLSRIETGDERIPSRSLLERLLDALDDPAAAAVLMGAAGRLVPEAERKVSEFPRALAEPVLSQRAVPALRRIDAGVIAEGLLARVPGRGLVGNLVDPQVLRRSVGLHLIQRPSDGGLVAEFDGDVVVLRDPGDPDDAAAFPRGRFLLAHVVGHVLLGARSCAFPRVPEDELPALDVAAHLLCPRLLLERAFREAIPELDEDARSPWSSRSAAVAAVVAERLAVPGWVALRRLADEGLLEDEAIYFSLGDRP